MRLITTYLFAILFINTYCQSSSDTHSSLQKLMKEAYIPGISLVAIQSGKMVESYHLGVKSIDTNDPITEHTVFSGASLSKCVFAVIVMQLVEEGKLDLDQPLMEYYTYEDLAQDERSEKVTARMVLSHITGLPNWRNDKLEFRNDPGEKFGYSGEGFVWLQKTVEYTTGKGLEELAQERIFGPLDMNRTSYIFLDSFENDYAIPHVREMVTQAKYKIQEANAAHSIQTTAKDYARFLCAVINDELLRSATTEMMFSPQSKVDSNELGMVMWGLGFGLQETSDGNHQYWHWGDNGTFKAYFTMDRKNKNGLVYFCNSTNGLSITEDVIQLFTSTPQPAITWNDYLYYQQPRFKFHIQAVAEGIFSMISSITNASGKLDTSTIKLKDAKRLASEWMWNEKYDLAYPLVDLLHTSFPEDMDILISKAKLHLYSGDPHKAMSSYQSILEKDPDHNEAKSILDQLTSPPVSGTLFSLPGYQQAKFVRVVGPFNNWNDTANIAHWKNGAWHCYINLEPGEYEYKFRIDGINILDPQNSENRHKGRYHVSVMSVSQ